MDDSGWRSRIRWVVVHPDRPAVLLVERAGALALPETELPARVWTADATARPGCQVGRARRPRRRGVPAARPGHAGRGPRRAGRWAGRLR